MDNRTALVTGANKGIGKEIAGQLADAGLIVYVGSRDAERGQRAVDEIGANARLLVLDVTDAESISVAANRVGALDVLVNNAGIAVGAAPPTEASLDVFRRTYETNVFGVLAVTNAFLPALRRSRSPRIVNVSSGAGSLAWTAGADPRLPAGGAAAAYRTSKTALNALTLCYAHALGDGFKVNAMGPGPRATDMAAAAGNPGGDPAEGAKGAVDLALLPDDGPTGTFRTWEGTQIPW